MLPLPQPTDPAPGATSWEAAWISGPAAGGRAVLHPGTHLLGRNPRAAVRVADPGVEPFHVQLEIGPRGDLGLVQVGGRAAVHLDGAAVAGRAAVAPVPGARHHLAVGSSRLLLTPMGPPAPAAGAPRPPAGRRVVRSARVVPRWEPAPVELPEAEQLDRVPPGGLVPALVALAGSAVIALVLGQPMFLLFGAIGSLVALGSWAAQHGGALRRRRRAARAAERAARDFAAALERQREDRRAHHRASVPGVVDAVRTATERTATLWARRAVDPDVARVSLGVGDVRWEPAVAAAPRDLPAECWGVVERVAVLADEQVPVDLAPGSRIALTGPAAAAVARSLVVQLAAQAGPADWRLIVVTDHPGDWAWAAALPHASAGSVVDEAGVQQLVRDDPTLGDRHLVVVVDQPELLTIRTSPTRRLVAGEATLVVIAPDDRPVPALCAGVLETRAGGTARWTVDRTTAAVPDAVEPAGITLAEAERVAVALRDLVDPEDDRAGDADLPAAVGLSQLLAGADPDALRPAAIAAAWLTAAPDSDPCSPVGVAADGVVDVALVRDGPHGLIAGTTGSGKSELLRSLVVGMATRLGPDHLTFVLVDYKGGATFDACARPPHVVGVVTDLDERLAERALRSLRAELRRRERVLREHGAPDLDSLRRAAGQPVVPRLVVVVDEFAALAVEQRDFLHALVDVAQRGRSLGVHLLLATQRPSGVVGDDIRANTNLRLALRVQDVADSIDVLGEGCAAALPRGLPGRAVVRLGADELLPFQAAHASGRRDGSSATELEELVDSVVEAASLLGLGPARRPWCDPLPAVLGPQDLVAVVGAAASPATGVVGVIDLPDEQRRSALAWRPADGHLAVVGSAGSGVGSTLRTLARSALASGATVAVIDACADQAWDAVDAEPGCAGVVRLHERERLLRLLLAASRRLDAAGHPSASRDHVVVVHGLAALRTELEDLDRSGELHALDRLVAEGPGRGVVLVVGAHAPAAVPASMLSRIAHRWVLHLHDAHDAPLLGVASRDVPPPVPGRAVVAAEAAAAQLVAPWLVDRPPQVAPARATCRIAELPRVLHASALDPPAPPGADGWSVGIGIDFDSLDVVRLDVPDGEHVVVLGPGRSGRSTVLSLLAAAWSAAGAGWLGVVAPRRSAITGVHLPPDAVVSRHVGDVLDACPGAGPALVVVDDAELVDDDGGRLAALVVARRPGLVVAAAARPEALRHAYGHWTAGVRRSRLGLVMTGAQDVDGDLLGASLPRRPPLAPRPGLAHLVADGATSLVQVAVPGPAPGRGGTSRATRSYRGGR